MLRQRTVGIQFKNGQLLIILYEPSNIGRVNSLSNSPRKTAGFNVPPQHVLTRHCVEI